MKIALISDIHGNFLAPAGSAYMLLFGMYAVWRASNADHRCSGRRLPLPSDVPRLQR